MTLYGLHGHHTGDLLTLHGRPIVHDNREELEWLLPDARVVPVTAQDLHARSPLPPMPLKEHPALAGLSWPLDRSQFRTNSRGGSGRPSGLTTLWSSATPNS